ncbi:MAG: secretin N-terminal domain-containing protein [Pirellulaceae bacterium]
MVLAYPLEHAAATNVKLLLDQIVRDATVLADDKLRQVVVTGSLETQAQVKAAIDQIDRTGSVRQAAEIRSYDAGQLTASALLTTLQAMWPSMQLTVDGVSNQVVASGTPEEHEQLEAAFEQLTSAPGGDAQLAKTYSVPFGEMSTLSSLLKQLAPRALLSPDPVSRTVTVWATPPQQELVEQALAALSQTARDAQQPATYMVKPTQLLAIQTSLRTLFPAAVSTSDPTTGQLVVVASQDVQSRIASVVEMLSNGAGADEATTKVFTFDPKQVELSNILVALKSTIPAQVRLESNPANHTLLAIGTAEDLERVSEQVQRLIEQMPSPDTMSSVVYPLRHANPLAAVTVLARLLPQSTLAPDVASKTISATAKAEDHKAIAEFLTGFDQPTVNDKETHVYRLLRGNGRGLSYVLSSLMPDATFYGSPDSGGLVATALPEQHERIAAIVKEFDNDRENVKTQVFVVGKGSAASLQVAIKSFSTEAAVTADQATDSLIVTATPEELKQIGEIVDQVKKGGNDKETHVYRLQRGDGRGLSFVLQSLMPDATFYGSRETGGLIATAQPEQHERIAAIVKEFDNERENVKTRVFVVGNGDAVSLQDAIANISSEASVTADRASNSLIVTATPEELEQIGEIVDQVEKGGSEPRSTRFYPVLGSEPIALSRALEGSFAKATFAADSAGGGLFATATEEEHAELAKVIEELNSQPTRLPTLKSFTLKHASPEAVAGALEDAFGRRSLAGVSFNRETRSVFVVGSRDDLQVAQALVEQIDVLGSNSDSRKMRVFSLGGADGRSISSAIENLFPESSAPVDVRYDPLNEQLFVVGDPEQIKLVEEMLEQLTPPERQLEIVQLEATDPYSFKLAADALFEDEPVNSAPSISIDSDQQRVIIRATDTQLVSLRKLLQQMGETPSGSRIGSSARLRFIPVHRNSEKLLDEIRRLWPAAGDNVLEVIRPAGNPNDTKNEKDKETRSEKNDGTDALEEEMPTAKLTSAPQANPVDTNTADEAASSGDKISDESSTAVPSEAADDSAGLKATDNQANRPAIVVVVGDEQWTVASADTQALDQFQRLLDTLLSPRIEPYSTTGNYSVYLLRHAGADQVQELLSDLFRPERGRSSSVSDLMQRVKIVADSRINALIVSGNRQDRRTVEELLGVLDSEDLLDSLQQITPTTLALESASANNVEAILRDVYRSQLSSGAGRRPVPIPEGVSSDVASLLQQLNAQSSGPLLTLAVDETSNSIIFRAPIELTAEIREFVESLDRKSQQTPSKRVDLIRLQSTNTKSLQQALKILLAK